MDTSQQQQTIPANKQGKNDDNDDSGTMKHKPQIKMKQVRVDLMVKNKDDNQMKQMMHQGMNDDNNDEAK